MRKSFQTILVATAVLALQTGLRATDATCPDSKTTATSATATCSADKGQHVMLKVKNSAECTQFEETLTKLEGVAKVSTCCTSKFTKVEFTKEKVCTDKILAALKDAGYTVEAQRVTYAVSGLACDACCSKVSTALAKVKGVSETQICHASKKAVVDFDPNKISADKVLAAIDATGFKAAEAELETVATTTN